VDNTHRLTVNGRVDLHLRRWSGAEGSVRPGEAVLGQALGQASLGFRQMACQLTLSTTAFADEARLLEQMGMGPVGKETLRKLVESEGRAIEQAYHNRSYQLAWQARDCPDDSKTASLAVIGADGVFTPVITEVEKVKRRDKTVAKRRKLVSQGKVLKALPKRKKGEDGPHKEVKIVGAYGLNHTRRHWRATVGNCVMAAFLMSVVARWVGLNLANVKLGLADGAEWINNALRRMLPGLTAIILDFYHLRDHVRTAAKQAFGEDSPQVQQVTDQLLAAIRTQGYEAFDALAAKQLEESQGKAAASKAWEHLRNYVSQREDQVNYPSYEAQGWPIGSGPTESMAKVLTSRIRGRGRRWDRENVQNIMNIQAVKASDEWDLYWQSQRKKAA